MSAAEKKIKWGLLLIVYSSLFVLGMMDNSRGPLYPHILDYFHLSNTKGSWFFSMASGTQLVTTILGQVWLRRWGSFRSLQIFLLVQSFGYLTMASSGKFAPPFAWICLLAGAGLFGISLGGLAIVQNTLVAESVPVTFQRRAYAGLHTMYGLASLSAPALIAYLIWLGMRWDHCFLVVGFIPLIIFIMTPILFRSGARKRIQIHSRPISSDHLWIAISLGFYVAAEIMISSRLSLYAERVLHLSETQAAGLLTLFFVFLTAGRMVFSVYQLKFSFHIILLVAATLSGTAFVAGLLWNPLFLALTGLAMAPIYPMTMAHITTEFPEAVDSVMALVMAVGGMALMLMHWGVGILTDIYGLRIALSAGPVCLFMITLGLIFRGKNGFGDHFSEGKCKKK